MGEEKDEMDQYGVGAGSRPKYFAFKVFGGWSAAGVMFTFLVWCWNGRNNDKKLSAPEVERIIRETQAQARKERDEDMERMFRILDQKSKEIDSATRKVDTLDASL